MARMTLHSSAGRHRPGSGRVLFVIFEDYKSTADAASLARCVLGGGTTTMSSTGQLGICSNAAAVSSIRIKRMKKAYRLCYLRTLNGVTAQEYPSRAALHLKAWRTI